ALGLTTGCIFQTTTGTTEEIRPPQIQTIVPPAAVVADAREGPPRSVRGADSIEAPDPPPPALVPAKVEMGSKAEMGPDVPSPVLPPPQPAPSPDPLAVTALRLWMEKHPEKAAKELERLDASRRERLLALLKLAAGVSEGQIEKLSPEEAASLLEQLRHVC